MRQRRRAFSRRHYRTPNTDYAAADANAEISRHILITCLASRDGLPRRRRRLPMPRRNIRARRLLLLPPVNAADAMTPKEAPRCFIQQLQLPRRRAMSPALAYAAQRKITGKRPTSYYYHYTGTAEISDTVAAKSAPSALGDYRLMPPISPPKAGAMRRAHYVSNAGSQNFSIPRRDAFSYSATIRAGPLYPFVR